MDRYREAISIAKERATALKDRSTTVRTQIRKELESLAVKPEPERTSDRERVTELSGILSFVKKYRNGSIVDQVHSYAKRLHSVEKGIEELDRQIDAQVALIHDSIFRNGNIGCTLTEPEKAAIKVEICKMLAWIQKERDGQTLRDEHLPRLQGFVGDIQESGFVKLLELFGQWNTQLEEYERCSKEFQDFYSNVCKALDFKPRITESPVEEPEAMPMIEGPTPSGEGAQLEDKRVNIGFLSNGPGGTPPISMSVDQMVQFKDLVLSLLRFTAIRKGLDMGVKPCCADGAAYKLAGESDPYGDNFLHNKSKIKKVARALRADLDSGDTEISILTLNVILLNKYLRELIPAGHIEKLEGKKIGFIDYIMRTNLMVPGGSISSVSSNSRGKMQAKGISMMPSFDDFKTGFGKIFLQDLAYYHLAASGIDPFRDDCEKTMEDPKKRKSLELFMPIRDIFYSSEKVEKMMAAFGMPQSYMMMIPPINFVLEDKRLEHTEGESPEKALKAIFQSLSRLRRH